MQNYLRKMSKLLATLMVLFLISTPSIFAHGGGHTNFSTAEAIIKQKIPCDQLTDDHLEALGDYYMERMHPGEAHEIMDRMMGGEGSETLRDMHIRIARAFYCGETSTYPQAFFRQKGHEAYGMMGGFGGGMMGWTGGFSWLITILLTIVLILAIVLLGKAILNG